MQKASPTHKQVEPAQTPLDNPASFAKFVGVSAQCVRNWCKAGIIPLTIKAGRIVRFERAAAIAALNASEAAAGATK
jgi:predicted site-specific integrase-resolvase